MNRKNGAEILNSIFTVNVEGENPDTTLVEQDYRNIVDFGKSIDTSGVGDGTFTTEIMGMVDKVGRTEFNIGEYINVAPSVWKDSTGYTEMLEEVNIEIGDFNESQYFSILEGDTSANNENSFEKLFGSETPVVSAKYYNTVIDYENKITLTDEQFKSAFKSAVDMDRFFSTIEARKLQKLNWAKSQMAYCCFDAMVLNAAKNTDNVKTLATDTTGALDAKSIAQLNNIIDELKIYSNKYSGFTTSTGKSNLRIAINNELYNDFIAGKSGVHNPQFLNIPIDNIDILPYMQYTNAPRTISGIAPTSTDGTYTKIENIVAVIWHDRSCGMYNAEEKISAQRIANRWSTNIFHMCKNELIVRTDYPCIIITANGISDVSEVDVTE